jgi:hypothetical protein
MMKNFKIYWSASGYFTMLGDSRESVAAQVAEMTIEDLRSNSDSGDMPDDVEIDELPGEII